MNKMDAEGLEARIQHHIEQGSQLVSGVAEFLNARILSLGKLQRNDHELWGSYLHKWDNREWIQALGYLIELRTAMPELFEAYHYDAIIEAELVLERNYVSEHDRILDLRAYKSVAWRVLMTMREVYNQANGIDLPNEDSSKPAETTTKERLFIVL